jgi:glycosyltransferase involved in cell wall biosynthesis
MNPLLSIVIATKNRVPYCINVIETILKFQDPDFELVIQDNTDTLELKNYVLSNLSDERLNYTYTPPPFSSIDNFNAAVKSARGEYLCLIGDDDGINPEIFPLVRWASLNKINAVIPSLNANYRWPDSGITSAANKEDKGMLTISTVSGRASLINSSKEVPKLIRRGGQGYLNFNLLKIYHGIIKKECMDKIKAITGEYFGGLSPDIYSSVALTLIADRIVKIDYPLTIPGICNKSTSSDSATGKHAGKLENAPHLRERINYSWADQVPKFYSVETIWADSAIAALKDMKRPDLLKRFNVAALTALCLKKHKAFSKTILKHYFDYSSSNRIMKVFFLVVLIVKYLELSAQDMFSRVIRKLFFEKITFTMLSNIRNINEAGEALTQYLKERSLSIDNVIARLDRNLD